MRQRWSRVVTMSGVITMVALGALSPGASVAGGMSEEGTGIRTLYLIRHGEYDHEDPRDPDVGKSLVPLGVAQARLIGSRLRSLPEEMTSLHSSTMTRARETALVIGEELPDLTLQSTRRLRECTPTTWREDIMAEESPEEVEACEAQLEEAWAAYFATSPDEDRHDVIVCHGNVIRYFVTKVLQVDEKAWLGMSIGNCSLTVVKIHPDGRMKLLSYGDVGHIPPNLQTRTAPGTPRDLSVPLD